MHPDNKERIEQRVIRAAETALADHKYVSAIDVFTGMGLLQPAHVKEWRQGRIGYLELLIQGNLNKISLAMKTFHRWAHDKGLKPSETIYKHRSHPLRFSKSGAPSIEKAYRTHYVSPELSERKAKAIEERLAKSPDPVVFSIIRESECSECGVELPRGGFLTMENEQPLCLACAGMGELEYLPAGDAALTRRAAKHSAKKAVVVRFSKSRGRYERQGVLVEPAALEKAEEECFEDAASRAADRARAAEARRGQDRKLVEGMAARIQELFPGCPIEEARAIAEHTAARGSGRVGRTAAGRELETGALTAAAVAAIRHRHTDYDELLIAGVDRALARERVADRVDEILAEWRSC